MNTDDYHNVSLKLRKRLKKELQKWAKEHAGLSHNDSFTVTSIAIATFIAEVSFLMFKNDVSQETAKKYIDDLCRNAKDAIDENKKDSSFTVQ